MGDFRLRKVKKPLLTNGDEKKRKEGTKVSRGEERSSKQLFIYYGSILFMSLSPLVLLLSSSLSCVLIEQLQGSSLETFMIIGKVASEAVAEAKMSQRRSFLSWIYVWLEEILLEARLFGMQIALWLLRIRKSLTF